MKLLNTSSYYRVFQTKDWPHLYKNFQPFQRESSKSSEIKMSNVHPYLNQVQIFIHRWQQICCQPGLVFNPDKAGGQCDWPYNMPDCKSH